MIDKRTFHYFLNQIKDEYPNYLNLVESIQDKFEKEVKPITKNELKALKQYPIQYVKKIELEEGEWTSQLHIWAEQCVPEILDLDPIYLAFKNSAEDSVLMSFIIGCTGAYTENIDYQLINKLLNKDLSYEDMEKENGEDNIVIKNAFDEKDLNGKTVIDYLIDFAYGIGDFEGESEDKKLKYLLNKFAENEEKNQEKTEDINEDEKNLKKPDKIEEESEIESNDSDDSDDSESDDSESDENFKIE